MLPFPFRHRLIRCPRLFGSLGFDLAGQSSHGSVYSLILQRCSRTSVTTSYKPITDHCHTRLDFRHITIAAHQDQCRRVLSALRIIGSISPGRNNLVCTEDELIPWPHRLETSAQPASQLLQTGTAARPHGWPPEALVEQYLSFSLHLFGAQAGSQPGGSSVVGWVQLLHCAAVPPPCQASARQALQIVLESLLHPHARLLLFLHRDMSSVCPLPSAGSG